MMGFRRLFIWVEGDDDVRFFEHIIKPMFTESYDWVEIRAYRQMSNDKFSRYLTSIRSMDADYLYVRDLDCWPCITAKKEQTLRDFPKLEADKVAVVVQEIESWYLAGLSSPDCKRMRVRSLRDCNSVTKEDFRRHIPPHYDSRIDFMSDILACFSVTVAKRKNKSFGYFLRRYIPRARNDQG